MTAQSHSWRPGRRVWFVLAAVTANAALVAWFWLTSAKTSPPAAEQPQAEEKPILFKERLQAKLAKETVEQLIKQLPDFDDMGPTAACLGGSMIETTPGTYPYSIHYYPNLNRGRKILEEGHDKAARVVPILEDKLAHAMDDYNRIIEEHGKWIQSRDPIVTTRWDEFQERQIYLSSAVYLLCQLRAYDALPLMAKLFIAQGDIPKRFAKDKMPIHDIQVLGILVNRLFLFYAMHHLARTHPRDKLSPQSLKRLDEYLEASKQIPPYPEVAVPSWHAKFDPWDYRITILGKDLGMDKQPHIRVYQFPETPYLEDVCRGTLEPEVRKWFAELKRFIDETYPTHAK